MACVFLSTGKFENCFSQLGKKTVENNGFWYADFYFSVFLEYIEIHVVKRHLIMTMRTI